MSDDDEKIESKNSVGDFASEDEERRLLLGGTGALSGCLRFFLVGVVLILIAYILFLIFRKA
jgi:hypothetical protein